MSEKKILITGSTGKIGTHLLQEIMKLNKGYKIRVLSLPTKKDKKILKPYASVLEIVFGSITNNDAIKKVIKNVDVIIHLAALVPPVVKPDSPLIEEINYGGTKLLIDEFKKENKDGIFIFASSVAVYGRRVENPEIRVTDPLNPNDAYGIAKVKAEKAIQESNLNYIIYRFGTILSAAEELNSLIFLQPLETCMEPLSIEDAAYLLARSIECSELHRGIYNVSGGERCRVKFSQMLNTMFNILGLGENLLPEEAFATKTMGHNGMYVFDDKNIVQELIQYQRYTLDDYYRKKAENMSSGAKFFMKMLKPLVKWYLLRMSEPYQALKKKDQALIDYYFYT